MQGIDARSVAKLGCHFGPEKILFRRRSTRIYHHPDVRRLVTIPSIRLLHLSDLHLSRVDAPNAHGVDARQVLRQLLADLDSVDVDLVVVSGDVADDGCEDTYRVARQQLEAFVAQRRVPLVISTGNQDERAAFARMLGNGHFDATGQPGAVDELASADGERAAYSDVRGYRIVTLDSMVPGKGFGRLSAAQLKWLATVLATPVVEGTVLVVHHPPVTLNVEVQRVLGLRNSKDLARVIDGTDVRLILCGHLHLQLSGHLGTAAVWVTPGVVNRIDLTAPKRTERAVRGASASLIELGGPYGPLMHVLHGSDPRAGQTVYELDEQQLDAVIARLGPDAG